MAFHETAYAHVPQLAYVLTGCSDAVEVIVDAVTSTV